LLAILDLQGHELLVHRVGHGQVTARVGQERLTKPAWEHIKTRSLQFRGQKFRCQLRESLGKSFTARLYSMDGGKAPPSRYQLLGILGKNDGDWGLASLVIY